MRKIILNLAVTLDGYIAGPNGEYDWCFTDADYGMTEFMKSVDATLMGRKTYDIVLQYVNGAPYPNFTNYVFSRTRTESEFENVRIVNEQISDFVKKIKSDKGKNIWLYGGAEIIAPLVKEDLVDEMILSVHPILLGNGIPLFNKISPRKNLTLVDTTSYPSGLVQLIYKNR
jgi:dihydrofolate reductase